MSYQLISLVLYNFILLFLLFVWIKTKGWQLNGTLYILFFLLISGIISTFYWNVSNGTIRNYSNLTIIPFLYLIIGYLITLMPIIKYDVTSRKELFITNKQGVFLHYFTFFLIIISFEPFLENLLHLPSVMANSDFAAKMYDNRVDRKSVV